MREEYGLPARKRKGSGQDGKRQRVREPHFFLRSGGFQPAQPVNKEAAGRLRPMLPKAAAKMAALPVNKKQAVANMRKMAAFPGGRLANRDT